jgi:hypothetical protein
VAQDTLVDGLLESGRELVQALADDGFEITAAFWAQSVEDDLWFLYIASPSVDTQGRGWAYRVVQAKIRSMPGLRLDSFDVKLIGSSSPIARIVARLGGDGREITRLGGGRLGDMGIDRVYIYPSPHAVQPP